jgi:hypothetical protein
MVGLYRPTLSPADPFTDHRSQQRLPEPTLTTGKPGRWSGP